ncbi:DLG associated protein 1 [Homo sapiens]|uniref:Disks large-associated protein 1 n=1 Tax=Homo sapiens TaxID=9606 RepID=DLGP1_HUMAN|nr:disks large-associated protein 1 isoform 1 [Homo sapiens]NP_004737.2 disks large-associated protein 1 isoform 1 [Homo sapiens]XP_047293889.1 disks large-associated protein 1 isoform X2 [Homo sapiens]XP_054175336.1 disks large-associated protein 1 isoform X2 [Homo sapiens]O14490.1 RecName: Full=Disks large-associated protein 1; Short=DAP-1; AltName: Full=Guanylate kinase-associated protein; Short=hGKAP; AltName: Full=PSD-95/SAP90-binding protein 1; AltName: Full=SAP90/PSD-95-associated protei|eukprot:NP_004737.2 disks large-associated protein 1 isoform 1 [Homo sapiens]
MKGLSGSRSHHHGVTCDSACDSLSHHSDRKPYLLSPVEHHPADHPYYTQRNSFQAECVGPFSDPLASSTFPRRHYTSQQELKDECALVPRTLATKANRIPANLLDQFERQLPLSRDGYHTLQYKRTAVEHRSDSPGRIRHLVHSVQKLFTKSHSLEGPSKGSVNGGKASPDEAQAARYGKRSKSKERRAEPKARPSTSPGWWSSDDNLDGDMCIYHAPSGVMTMGRCPDRSASQYFLEAYNTISEQAVKASRSNNDVKCSTCANLPVSLDTPLLKKSAWSSTLTVSRAREVYQKASVNMDQAMVKSESCQQERSCQYLQVPQDEWTGYTPRGKDDEIPCRRMRSGSYIKAMGDEDSGDSDTSPKPSPKVAARRESYLKATQPSLTELTTLKISNEHSPKLQIRSHSYLRAVSEVSINRSLDSLDPAGLLTSPKFRSRNESYMRAMSTISQVSEMEVNGQFESVCESVFSELESQAVEALDLPMPGCFRMRSHSYVRAIEKGCSQDDECVSLRSSSPPRTTTTVRTIQSSTVSSCITTYKKTPPPVPPRTTTKPFISITAQSSTESAQDAYMDGQGQRGDIISQSGLSNSTESLDSMKALTAAIEAANAQIHGPASQHMGNNTATVTTTTTIATVTTEDRKKDHFKKNRCLSIGIQVDDAEEPDKTGENKAPSKFQSVGVQVEEEKCFRRFTRSNSVTTAVQADLDFHDNLENSLESIEDNSCPGPMARQFSRDASTSTVSIQGSGNHYHACAADDDFDTDFDPSILPPPDPWIDSITEDPLEAVQRSVCHRDGHWFLKLLQAERDRMEGWCQQMEREERENNLPEDILGKIRTAVGSAQLLMAQKFYQFRELCEENLNPNAHPRPTSQDLAGFWDMLQLSIENISMKFDELHQLKANNWKQMDPLDKKERRAPPPVPKKPAKGPAPLIRERSLESSQRQEARKRLMAAKRAASVRQNSATESAESIEIYIPEAQTRL